MGLKSFLKSNNDDKIRKIRSYFDRKRWKYRNSAHLSLKLKNEIFLLLHRNSAIVIDGWLPRFYKKKSNVSNWGDDINVYFIEQLSGKRVVPAQALFFPKNRKKFCVIGTVIPSCVGKKTTIWGSGYGLSDSEMVRPLRVLAVRGPKTRHFLMEKGIDCPEIYGDPALLLPKYYTPSVKTKKTVGIIPHHLDWDCDLLHHYDFPKEWEIINLTAYDNWTDVIDQICSCELILSSSLHGLIVSDAYNVPNLFVEFCHHHSSYKKYEDYFLSVGRNPYNPYEYSSLLNIENLRNDAARSMETTKVNVEELMNVCPFIVK